MGVEAAYRDIYVTSSDGLALYARDYPAPGNEATPVLCLCGLTRNMRDFLPLTQWLGGRRRLILMDYRGRGRSAYAPDPMTYRPDVELADALGLLNQLEIDRVSVIGTSRGGIIAMLMAVEAPQRLRSVLLNDVGPVIEKPALLRIGSYLGQEVDLAGWDEAVDVLKDGNSGFETLSPAEWLAFAKRVYVEREGRIRHDYDLNLARTFPSADHIEEEGAPELWPLFAALAPFPVTVLRGENSDLLSARTIAEMKERHPFLAAHEIGNRGHVPFLDEPDAKAAIESWLATA